MEKKRFYYLDILRVFLVIVVIFHHAGQAYGDGGGWAYTPSNPAEYSSELWRYFSLNAGFFMGLFFMISGYFVPSSFDRYGAKVFIRKKLLRLGVPMLLFCTFLSLLSKSAQLAHLWFVFMLLMFCLVYALFRLFTGDKCLFSSKPLRIPQSLFLLLLALGLSGVEFFTRRAFPQDYWFSLGSVNFFEPAHFPQYLLMFILGIWAKRKGFFEDISTFTGVACCIVAGLIAGVLLFNPGGVFTFEAVWPLWWVGESFFCISVSFALIWFLRSFANRGSRALSFLSDQEYGVYIFHLTNILIIQHFFDGLFLGGGVSKMLFIGGVSTVVTFFLTYLLRLIPGVKKVI